jgi:hypothetical protein
MRSRAAIVLLLAAAMARAAGLPPTLDLRSAEALRTPEGQLAFVLHFAGPPDPARARVLIDLDGRARGEPGTGAEYMIEGTHFLRFPPGSPPWTWKEAGALVALAESNRLVYLLAPPDGMASFRWSAETTRADWTAGDRFPAEGDLSASFAQLPLLPPDFLARPVADPRHDLLDARAFRLDPAGLALQLTFAGEPDIPRVRLLLDTGAGRGEPALGADYLIEGATLYAYPEVATGWSWNALEPALWIQDRNTLTCLLLNLPATGTVRWAAETTTPDWQVADRLPAMGARTLRRADLPPLPDVARPQAVEVDELMAQVAPSLTVRFEDELDTQEWERVTDVAFPAWSNGVTRAALPLRLFLTDATTDQRVELSARVAYTSDGRKRWGGHTLGIDWVLLADSQADGALQLSAQLKAAAPRCVTLSVGVEMDLGGWTWHDDVQTRRLMEPQGDYFANVSSLPFGRRGEQSPYLFGVVSSGRGALVVETDPDEPRVYQITAEPVQRWLGLHYDLGLSPLTAKFQGRAAIRCQLRARPPGPDDAFRDALADFYDRYPDFKLRRSPEVGLWMPFMDISKLPQPQDFGFAFYEQGGTLGADADYGESNRVLTLYYTEPWLYWLPMAPSMPRTPEQALFWMRTLATMGNALKNDFAASALVSTTRTTNGAPLLSFIDTPWNAGARMEVSTDPELPVGGDSAVNRAMVEWKIVQGALDDPRVDGIYLDSMQAMQVIDYNPAALAVADHPPAYAPDARQPGLAMHIAAYEYTSALSRHLHGRDRLLMGNFPCWRWPFFMPYIDIPGEETSWLGAGTYAPMPDRDMAFRRAISGHKPWGFLQAVNFKVFDERMVERYFRDCLYWAFLPSFFSHDGANDPYWADPALLERDRHLFRTYLPLIRRLAAAGWEPRGPIRAEDPELLVEHFGTDAALRHVTLRQRGALPLRSHLLVPRDREDLLVVDPLNGSFEVVAAGEGVARVPCLLGPDGVATRDLVRASALGREIDFARAWTSGGSEAAAFAASLSSHRAEREIAAHVQLTLGAPLVRGRDQPVGVAISNAGPTALLVSNLVLVGRAGPQTLRADALRIEPGQEARVEGFLDTREVADGTWLDFRWDLARDGRALAGRRLLRPLIAPPVYAAFATTNIVSVDQVAGVALQLFNVADRARTVRIQARGDFEVAETDVTLAAAERRRVQVEIPSGGRRSGRLLVRLSSGDALLSETPVRVSFLDESASLGRDSRVTLDVDSIYGGYTTLPLTDGITDTTGLPWNESAWASEETAAPHWVRFRFPEPTAVSELRMVWNHEGGVRYASRRGVVRGRTQDGQLVELGGFTNTTAVESTVVSFEALQLQSIELVQPVGGGAAARPNLLWLSEIEVR